jgi:hypothetical protein
MDEHIDRTEQAEGGLSRRDLMRLGVAGLVGMGLSSAAAPTAAWAAGGVTVKKSGPDGRPTGETLVVPSAALGNFILGTSNSADTSSTRLSAATTGDTFEITNTNSSTGGVALRVQHDGTQVPAAYINNAGQGITLSLDNDGTGSHLHFIGHTAAGAPTVASGHHLAGSIWADVNNVLWHCVVSGTPGTWVPMRSTVPLDSPKRVIDTRYGTGGISGRLVKKRIYTFNSFLATAGIPTQAVAVIGNLTMVAPEGLKSGAWMAIVPAKYNNGVTMPSGYPGVSTINSGPSDAIANQFTCSLGTGAYAGKVSIMWDGTSNVQPYAIVDVTGYII